jgi:hypothetical protein
MFRIMIQSSSYFLLKCVQESYIIALNYILLNGNAIPTFQFLALKYIDLYSVIFYTVLYDIFVGSINRVCHKFFLLFLN